MYFTLGTGEIGGERDKTRRPSFLATAPVSKGVSGTPGPPRHGPWAQREVEVGKLRETVSSVSESKRYLFGKTAESVLNIKVRIIHSHTVRHPSQRRIGPSVAETKGLGRPSPSVCNPQVRVHRTGNFERSETGVTERTGGTDHLHSGERGRRRTRGSRPEWKL